MTLYADQLIAPPLRRTTDPTPTVWLKRLIDSGTLYMPQSLSPAQFATLQAVILLLPRCGSHYAASRVDANMASNSATSVGHATSASHAEPDAPAPPVAFDYRLGLGLDELETITRTRSGYSFTDLHSDLQDAILGLIATRDLTTRKLDLARWLEDLHTHTLALAA